MQSAMVGGPIMKNLTRRDFLGLCALLSAIECAMGCTGSKGASSSSAVQMISFNKDLEPVIRDDFFRTTYEIFPYSFCDSNGDGIGDLNGIRSKLDYIAGMGFDQLWLTPVHPSSTYHKYDVDDYYAIDPTFGTMEDYEALLAECHERGIRVLLDLVLNHTSDTHPWFVSAVEYLKGLPADKDPVREECPYVWYYTFSREQLDGFVPLEGTPWYYEARFWSEMPDLNLGNDETRGEIRSIVHYWLDKGVDGFRLDAVTSYMTGNAEGNAEFLRFVTDTCKSIKPDCYLVGEAWTDRPSIAGLYTSGIDSLFNFPFADSGGIIRNVMNGSYAASYGLSLLMPGNSFVYYGEEIGMKGSGKDENKRAPMYWSSDPHAEGMCAGPPDMEDVQMKFPALEEQLSDDLSLYRWFTEVIRVRRAFPSIARGTTEPVDAVSDGSVAAFIRHHDGDDDVLVVMNLREEAAAKDLSAVSSDLKLSAVLNTSEEGIAFEGGTLSLPPYSIAVLTQ